MDAWFLRPDLMDRRNEALSRPEIRAALPAKIANTAIEIRNDNAVAVIPIRGILSESPDPLAFFLGIQTTAYGSIRDALAAADTDPRVSAIRLEIDSPGGTVAGAFETAAAIASAKKPITALVMGEAASAAYLLASQAGRIVASGPASMVGSIGIAAGARLDPNRVDITSTDAPDKRPDLSTEAGRQVIREQLDGLHEIMVEAIAAGRGTTPEAVNSDFGRGRMVLAREAKEKGMIDAAEPDGATGAKKSGGKKMDLQELRAQHPEAYAAAVAEGANQERARVAGHLDMGKRPGCQTVALEAIASGAAMTAELTARYMDAALAAATVATRKEDEPDPVNPEPKPDPAPSAPGSDLEEEVAARVAAHFGLEA